MNTMIAPAETELTPVAEVEILIPATIPFGTNEGSTTTTVLYNTLTGMHVCPEGDYTAEKFVQVWAHRKAHTPRKPKAEKPAEPTIGSRFDQLFDMLIEIEKVAETAVLEAAKPVEKPEPIVKVKTVRDRTKENEWKARALVAEKKLRSFQKLMKDIAA